MSSAAAAPYIPPTPATPELQTPLAVVGPQFCMPHPIDLALNTKQMSVKDINGNVVLRVREKLFRLRDKNKLIDSNGNALVSMIHKFFTAHSRWQVFRGESFDPNDLLFTVKKSAVWQRKTELDVYLAANTTENAPDFTIKGSHKWFCTVYLRETITVLARMNQHDINDDILGVTIYPNVDYAFIIALVVIVGEINGDGQASSMTSGFESGAILASAALNFNGGS